MPIEIPVRTTVIVNIIKQTNIFLMKTFTKVIFIKHWLTFCNIKSNGETLGNKICNTLAQFTRSFLTIVQFANIQMFTWICSVTRDLRTSLFASLEFYLRCFIVYCLFLRWMILGTLSDLLSEIVFLASNNMEVTIDPAYFPKGRLFVPT